VFAYDPDIALEMLTSNETQRSVVAVTDTIATLQFVGRMTFLCRERDYTIAFELTRLNTGADVPDEVGDRLDAIEQRMDKMNNTLHAAIVMLLCGRSRENSSSDEVLFMKSAGVPATMMPVRYRFGALVDAVSTHNSEVCGVLLEASDDVFTHKVLDRSPAAHIYQIMDRDARGGCGCDIGSDRYGALLMVAIYMHAHDIEERLTVNEIQARRDVLARFMRSSANCRGYNHAADLARRAEIGRLLGELL
jgi:hypothetical protein